MSSNSDEGITPSDLYPMSTNTSRGRISRIRPLTMLPSLKSRRDFAISSCISVIKELQISTNHGLPKFAPNRATHTDGYLRNQREAKDSHPIEGRKRRFGRAKISACPGRGYSKKKLRAG